MLNGSRAALPSARAKKRRLATTSRNGVLQSRGAPDMRVALDGLAGDWWGHAEPANNAYAVGDTSADDLKAQADHYEELFDRVVQSLRRIEQDHELWLDPEISESVTTVGPQDWLRRSAEHRRFFIVDEPERHLHPRQRDPAESKV